MSRQHFFQLLNDEINRIDKVASSKRHEKIIEGFTNEHSPKAIIGGERYQVFNSNDYLGLRHNLELKQAEHLASTTFGTGPGAVRFISGTLAINTELEHCLAKFHKRDDAMVFSSAFAANMAVLFSLIVGQSKDSLVTNNVLVVSDELNHRSIIDGIRIANLPKEQRAVFKHLDPTHLEQILELHKHTYDRVVVVTDGVFSMLGEIQKLGKIRQVVDNYDQIYKQGVLLVVDDAHGIGALGDTGRGSEQVTKVSADVLVGTLGKALGADGGYVVANTQVINYLRESAATYIYSNSISPGTAAAALRAVRILDETQGKELIVALRNNIGFFKQSALDLGLKCAVDSMHPIQPILIGDPQKTAELTKYLFKHRILATKINYPVVPQGRDEIRVQLSSVHTKDDINYLLKHLAVGYKKMSV